jgi:hypothetical protein
VRVQLYIFSSSLRLRKPYSLLLTTAPMASPRESARSGRRRSSTGLSVASGTGLSSRASSILSDRSTGSGTGRRLLDVDMDGTAEYGSLRGEDSMMDDGSENDELMGTTLADKVLSSSVDLRMIQYNPRVDIMMNRTGEFVFDTRDREFRKRFFPDSSEVTSKELDHRCGDLRAELGKNMKRHEKKFKEEHQFVERVVRGELPDDDKRLQPSDVIKFSDFDFSLYFMRKIDMFDTALSTLGRILHPQTGDHSIELLDDCRRGLKRLTLQM